VGKYLAFNIIIWGILVSSKYNANSLRSSHRHYT
jgi:hypothetical protein